MCFSGSRCGFQSRNLCVSSMFFLFACRSSDMCASFADWLAANQMFLWLRMSIYVEVRDDYSYSKCKL